MQQVTDREGRRITAPDAAARRAAGAVGVITALALSVALAACASPEGGGGGSRSVAGVNADTAAAAAADGYGRLSYSGPGATPAGPYRAILPIARDAAFEEIIEGLARDDDFGVLALSPEDGLIVAYYGGAAEPYVDCGRLTVLDGSGRQVSSPAPAGMVRDVRILDNGRHYDGERELRLDARAIIRLDPAGTQTTASVESQYVLSSFTTARIGGQVVARRAHMVGFPSGGGASFDTGVRCVPTGRLERAVVPMGPADQV